MWEDECTRKAIKMSKTKPASHYIGSNPVEDLSERLCVCMFMRICLYGSKTWRERVRERGRVKERNIVCVCGVTV